MVEKEDKFKLETIIPLGIILLLLYALTFGFTATTIFNMLIAAFMTFVFLVLLFIAIMLRDMHQSTTLLVNYSSRRVHL
jgi:Na+/proline symporter